ncbi:MAG TPA: hemolysin family protein [Myxococcales bacterium]|nr:hemolysin family protein [Myxococcales bacterium]
MLGVPSWEYVTIACCLVLSGFFSASETALTALGEAKVRQHIESGRSGKSFLSLWLAHPERVLATLLLGSTLVTIGASALATAIAARFVTHAVAVATGVMTLVLLFFGEVTPKTLAKRNAEKVALALLPFITAAYWLLFPFAWPLYRGTVAISRFLVGGKEGGAGPSITSEEIEYMIDLGTREGVLDKVKEELLNSVLEFADILVKEIMVPRTQMLALDRESSPDELLDAVVQSQHSRIPVYQGSVDNVVGVLYVKMIVEDLRKGLDRAHFRIDKYLRPPFFVPEIMKISRLLKEFQKRKTHIAIVVDEFGGTSGLVCLEDVVEEIVGEIQDESDVEEGPVKVLSEGRVLAEGSVPIRDLEEILQVSFPENGNYETLGGFLVATAGRVPPQGSLITWNGLTFTVLSGDERRVVKVEIHKRPHEPRVEPPRASL